MPTERPRLLDLFCSAGGCTKGYQRAGFYVVGVDNRPQPNYCGDEFIQADALALLEGLLHPRLRRIWARYGWSVERFAVIHASTPCQDYLNLTKVNRALGRGSTHPDLVAAVREKLLKANRAYVLENVADARPQLRDPVRLCGSSFGLPIRRHRLFESNFPLLVPPCDHSWQTEKRYWTGWRPKGEHRLSTVVQVYGNAGGKEHWPEAMGIDWMTNDEMAEAIPPAYTEHIGHQLMQHITRQREAA